MLSAAACYAHAQLCESLARATDDAVHKRILETVASQWRNLGNCSNAHAAAIARYCAPRVSRERHEPSARREPSAPPASSPRIEAECAMAAEP